MDVHRVWLLGVALDMGLVKQWCAKTDVVCVLDVALWLGVLKGMEVVSGMGVTWGSGIICGFGGWLGKCGFGDGCN
jgi:hypothetical protein